MKAPCGRPYRILAIDGGGVRGVFAAKLIERLIKALGKEAAFLESIDLFAGTSTGAILALGLAAGVAPAELVELYAHNALSVFERKWFGLFRPKYSQENLEKTLTETFKATKKETLGDLEKKVLVPSFDLFSAKEGMWKPKFFHNFAEGSDGDQRIVDVALRSSAAPYFFPSHEGYVDGGVAANNPSMAALAQAIDEKTGGAHLDDVYVLSIGTGTNKKFVKGEANWGLAWWARKLVHLMIEGGEGVAHYQCDRLLGARYHRLAPMLEEDIALDAAGRVGDLVRGAEAAPLENVAHQATVDWVKTNFLRGSSG